jgi:hypothetical protein
LVTLFNAVNVGHAPVVRYQGNVYLTVKKADSQHTQCPGLRITPGYIPLLNIKSHTLRGVHVDELVEPLNAEMVVTPWIGGIEHDSV